LARIRSPATRAIPSTVCVPDRVRFAVDAAFTDGCESRPCANVST
jgi:hypothetical protein